MGAYGQRIRSLRRERNFTQLRIAAITGMPNYTLSLIEHDKRMPTAVEIDKLARALGVTPNDILWPIDSSIPA